MGRVRLEGGRQCTMAPFVSGLSAAVMSCKDV